MLKFLHTCLGKNKLLSLLKKEHSKTQWRSSPTSLLLHSLTDAVFLNDIPDVILKRYKKNIIIFLMIQQSVCFELNHNLALLRIDVTNCM